MDLTHKLDLAAAAAVLAAIAALVAALAASVAAALAASVAAALAVEEMEAIRSIFCFRRSISLSSSFLVDDGDS